MIDDLDIFTDRWSQNDIKKKVNKMAAKVDQLIDEQHKAREKENGESENQYKTWNDYCEALNKWNMECHRWYAFHAMFPYYVAQQLHSSVGASTNTTNNQNTTLRSRIRGHLMLFAARTAQNDRQAQESWSVYKTATLWKRIAAELIDFMLLFSIKLFITFIIVDYFQLLDVDRYSKVLRTERLDKLSYAMLMELTSELMILEMINRLVICLFEAMCLQGGNSYFPGPGGATPGKKVMGLRVISCKLVTWHLTPESRQVSVLNASDLGFWRAFGRSALKNLSIAFCIPASFTVHLFQHNRAVYDIIFSCIVVEDDPQPN